MIFDGFSVDNLYGYRQHFSLKSLLEAIDNRFVLASWISAMLQTGALEADDMHLMEGIRHCFEAFCQNKALAEGEKISGNRELGEQMRLWERKVVSEKTVMYQNLSELLLRLLALAECEIPKGSKQEEILHCYLVEEGYFRPEKLELKPIEPGVAGVFYGNLLVCRMECGQEEPDGELLCVARHPDTGYLGIDANGQIVNGSAFFIPETDKGAVKADLSRSAYVILLEDGTLLSNLRYTKLPDGPVRNVELQKEQLIWQMLEDET